MGKFNVVKDANGEVLRVGDAYGTSSGRGYIDAKACLNHGQLMSHSRPLLLHTCICGSVFEGIRTAKYCSNSCRQKAKRMRK